MNKFFKRLLVTFVSITLGYTLLLFSFNFFNAKSNANKALNKNNEFFISQIKTNLDSKFIMAKDVINYMKYNEYLIKYNDSAEIDYYTAYKLQSIFSQNQSSFSELGYIISVLKENTDMVITPFGTRDLESFLLENGIPLHYSETVKNSFSNLNKEPVLDGYLSKKLDTSDIPFTGQSLTFTEKFFIEDNKLLFFLVFYEDSLIPKNILGDGEALILYEDKRILFNNSNLDKLLIKDIIENESKHKDYYIYKTQSSTIPNGGYIYITPKKNWGTYPKQDFYRSLSIYILLILFSVTISYFITKNNYKPINNMLNTLNFQGKNRDEFQYIQEATKKIQEANIELSNNILKERIPLQVKFLRDCLNGLLRKDEIERNLKKYGFNIESDKITAVVIHFNNDDVLMNNFSNETIVSIRNKVSYIIEEHLKLICRFELIDISYLSSTAIIFDLLEEDIRAAFKKVLVELSSNEELDITVSIGITINKFINIKRSYFTAISELDKWSGISKNLLPVLNDGKQNLSINFFYPLETERRIIKYVSTGKEESLLMIHSVLERNKDSLHLSKEEWASFIRAIIRTIKRVLTQVNKTEKIILNNDVSVRDYIVGESRNHEVLKSMDVFKKIIKSVQETSKGEQKTFADKLIKYVNENYSDANLSLIDIAEYFSLSPAYISRIFKDFTGRNFKDLLSLERIKKSKVILNKNPNVKVYKLGTEVGFNSTNTFLRTFKKYTGISPGKYAKSVIETNN